ncbi:hypothetical protein [Nocardiopsis sp. CNT312]|uniref:hypothetical protein n=1 Tax=Nocardiopsis sp. CNT312 TaxID=1137268 RepID=UPI0004B08DF4|nr:hypothetical protein [Nocardiopsis sp. CNT312]
MPRYSTAATALAACAAALSIAAPAHAAEGALAFEVVDWHKVEIVEHAITDTAPGSCHSVPEETLSPERHQEFYRFTNGTERPVLIVRNSCEEFEADGRAEALRYVAPGDSIRELPERTKAVIVLREAAEGTPAEAARERR